MLNFRILIGAVILSVAFTAAVLFSFDEGDVSIATFGPRPSVDTAAAPRAEPTALPSKAIVIPKPLLPPAAVALPVPADGEVTGSIDAAPVSQKEIASPPRQRPRVAARKKEGEEVLFNPFQLFFPLQGNAKPK